jgi:hypothetical protein
MSRCGTKESEATVFMEDAAAAADAIEQGIVSREKTKTKTEKKGFGCS